MTSFKPINISTITNPEHRKLAEEIDDLVGGNDGVLGSKDELQMYADMTGQKLANTGAPAQQPTTPVSPAPAQVDDRMAGDFPMNLNPAANAWGLNPAGMTQAPFAGMDSGIKSISNFTEAGATTTVVAGGHALLKGAGAAAKALKPVATRLWSAAAGTGVAASESAVTTSATAATVATVTARGLLGSSVVGATIGASISLVENTIAVSSGTRTMAEAGKDVGKDTIVCATVGAATYATSAVVGAALVSAGAGALTVAAAPVVAAVVVGVGVAIGARWLINKVW